MKKSIYILGMVSLSLILVGSLFKIMHLPGAAILLTVGITSITVLFLPIALFRLLKSTDDALLKFVYWAAFISFSVDFVGMLFKIMHWPGAGWFMIIGVPLPFVLFLPAYMVYHNKRKLKTNLSFFGILLFMIYLGVFSSLLALDASYAVYRGYAQSAASLSETNAFLAQETQKQGSSDIAASADKLVQDIETLKQKLAVNTEPENKLFINSEGTLNYLSLLGKNIKPGVSAFDQAGLSHLMDQLEQFYQVADTNTLEIARLIQEIDRYTKPIYEGNAPIITQLPLITALCILTDWQNKILLISYLSNTSIKMES